MSTLIDDSDEHDAVIIIPSEHEDDTGICVVYSEKAFANIFSGIKEVDSIDSVSIHDVDKIALGEVEDSIDCESALLKSKKKKPRSVTWGDEKSLELVEIGEAAEYDRKELSYVPSRRSKRRRGSSNEFCSPLQKKMIIGVVVVFVVILIILLVVIFAVLLPQSSK